MMVQGQRRGSKSHARGGVGALYVGLPIPVDQITLNSIWQTGPGIIRPHQCRQDGMRGALFICRICRESAFTGKLSPF